MKIRISQVLMILLLSVGASAFGQSRRAYGGVVEWKKKTIGTVILLDIDSNNGLKGWIRLGKFLQIDSGTVTKDFVEFRSGENQYKIDERKERITYSGPDGEGDRYVFHLAPVRGKFTELIEGDRFSGAGDRMTLDINGRLRKYTISAPAIWKNQGPPFEKFERMEEFLQRDITLWVTDSDSSTSAEVIEEPEGMNVPLKAPKRPKEKKSKDEKNDRGK